MEASSERLDFPALLGVMQEWLGCDLCVMVHQRGAEFNIGFCACLERVRSPHQEHELAILDFEGARELTLAPVEGIARLHTVAGRSRAARASLPELMHLLVAPCLGDEAAREELGRPAPRPPQDGEDVRPL